MEENRPCGGGGERHRFRVKQGKDSKNFGSFVLRTYIVGEIQVKRLHVD